jgi:hypothetical protein
MKIIISLIRSEMGYKGTKGTRGITWSVWRKDVYRARGTSNVAGPGNSGVKVLLGY